MSLWILSRIRYSQMFDFDFDLRRATRCHLASRTPSPTFSPEVPMTLKGKSQATQYTQSSGRCSDLRFQKGSMCYSDSEPDRCAALQRLVLLLGRPRAISRCRHACRRPVSRRHSQFARELLRALLLDVALLALRQWRWPLVCSVRDQYIVLRNSIRQSKGHRFRVWSRTITRNELFRARIKHRIA